MNLVVIFSQPISQRAVDCFMGLLSEEIECWGGFRGKRIAQISPNPISGRTDPLRLHFHVYYEGDPEGEEEVVEAFRDALNGPGGPWGIGAARVLAVGRS